MRPINKDKKTIRDDTDRFAQARMRMVKYDIEARGISDKRLLQVLSEIPREQFVPAELKSHAYADSPLPIGCDQTISQPYIVALMTEQLKVKDDMEVLEIGTGSGYQTAILAKLARKVYTIERFERLSQQARERLKQLGLTNIEFYVGDGSCGWPQPKVFPRIMVTAAVPQIPQPLIDQLEMDGIIVAPVGPVSFQKLIVARKTDADKLTQKSVCEVRFVKLIGKYAFEQ